MNGGILSMGESRKNAVSSSSLLSLLVPKVTLIVSDLYR